MTALVTLSTCFFLAKAMHAMMHVSNLWKCNIANITLHFFYKPKRTLTCLIFFLLHCRNFKHVSTWLIFGCSHVFFNMLSTSYFRFCYCCLLSFKEIVSRHITFVIMRFNFRNITNGRLLSGVTCFSFTFCETDCFFTILDLSKQTQNKTHV